MDPPAALQTKLKPVKKTLLAMSLGAALIAPPNVANGGETMIQLLKVLRDRGSISDADYQMLVEAAKAEATAAPAPASPTPPPVAAPSSTPVPAPGESRVEQAREKTDKLPSTATVAPKAPAKWYDRVNFRGYLQLRYSQMLDHNGADLHVPNDASVTETGSFMIRRGRVILSGDATDRLYVYAQSDFSASLSSGDIAVAMRDYYGDVAFDDNKEYRVRLGQSKVPYGFVNLQSSQNRLAMERPDALNGAVEGERDIGAFFYWSPAEIRTRFRDLVRNGLKGSGDYGVFALGAYSGQGLNRLDLNGEPHVVARLTYPFKLSNGQFVEAGIQGYHGKFASSLSSINLGNGAFTPTRPGDGVVDQRAGASFIWYPQPFGVEAEWNMGRGPELNPTTRAIESEFLHGGYVQMTYRVEKKHGDWFPFVRWQYYDGGRKFAANAPHEEVNELDVGVEWQPWHELEVVAAYTHTFRRTNTRVSPYVDTESADRVSFQAQFNF